MQNIKSLITEEIRNIDEMLERHSYHKIVLESLLDKINGSVATTTVQPVKREESTGRVRHNINREKMIEIAKAVGKLCREKGISKKKAVSVLVECGDIPEASRGRVESSLNRSYLAEMHDEFFRGTRYASI
jgi:predicted secreted protein